MNVPFVLSFRNRCYSLYATLGYFVYNVKVWCQNIEYVSLIYGTESRMSTESRISLITIRVRQG